MPHREDVCCPDCCHETVPGVNRRRFLSLSAAAAGAAVLAAQSRDAFAAGALPQRALAPVDKGFTQAWIDGLYRRGTPTRYAGHDLGYIGMPVGGGGCGQVYLGGDGGLWYFDVDNGPPAPGADSAGGTYAGPRTPSSPFGHGFVLRTTTADGQTVRSVDGKGFSDIAFTGQYPLGQVDYQAADCPVSVRLEAFSPFVPGEVEDSTLPVTVLAYTLTNTSSQPVTAELIGWAENPVCLRGRTAQPIRLSSGAINGAGYRGVQFTAANAPATPQADIVFENWERADYQGWTVQGEAFGTSPVLVSEVPDYMMRFGDLHVRGQRFVTSHNFRTSNGDAGKADGYTGKLTSKSFTIQRRYLTTRIGGGNQPGQACLNVIVAGSVVATITGSNTEPLSPASADLIRYQGKTAHIEIVDSATVGWGHVNVDDIVFADVSPSAAPVDKLTDGGTVALAALMPDTGQVLVRPSLADWSTPAAIATAGPGPADIDGGLGTITGAVTVPLRLEPGQSGTVRFALTWYFPNPDREALSFLTDIAALRRHYAERFASAEDVVGRLARDLTRLETATRAWVNTWYTDSTLPHWFLERTLTTASTLATSTCLRLSNGRFYGWEGVGCCDGTCEHVWNYAQSIGLLFPALERDTRQRVDLGIGFHPDRGEIGNRAEADMGWATDGQCGTILRIYREHQMAPDGGFLRTNWPRIKQAVSWVIAQDGRKNGTLEGPQPNTLDAVWYGEIAWMTGMYDAALFAGAEMADEVGDTAFAAQCRALAEAGARSIASDLWTGEYFVQLVDPAHPEAVNSNIGCHIDQMFGQSLAWQLDLPRVFPADKTATALGSIYRYNFVPDPAAYRAANTDIQGGRWFAMAGEPAVIMTTFPHGGAKQSNGNPPTWQAGYFNESWTGQEYQLAAHMIREGMLEQGLTITRAVHDRYAAGKRNPYNEIECSEHYARAMAGYGVFLAACGFSYHGPKGRLGFAPKITPENFAAAFTTAQGWGLYRQQRQSHQQTGTIEMRHGMVRLSVLVLELSAPRAGGTVEVEAHVESRPVRVVPAVQGTRLELTLADSVTITAGQRLEVVVKLP